MTQGQTIVDDRGKQVQPFEMRSHLVGLDARTISPGERELLAKVNMSRSIERDGSFSPHRFSVFTVMHLMVFAYFGLKAFFPGLPRSQVLLIVVAFTGLISIRLFFKDVGTVRAARTLVANGRCGSCFYPLKDARTEDDGNIGCPECGAAWKAASVGVLRDVAEPQGEAGYMPGNLFKPSLPVIEDDRGRLVFAANPYVEVLEKRFERGEANEIALLVHEGSLIRRQLVSVFGIALCSVAITVAAVDPKLMGLPTNAVPVVVAFCVLALLFLLSSAWREYRRFARRTDQESGPHIRGRLLKAWRCATCAVRINVIKPEADGCRVCAKCGSAWKSLGAGKK